MDSQTIGFFVGLFGTAISLSLLDYFWQRKNRNRDNSGLLCVDCKHCFQPKYNDGAISSPSSWQCKHPNRKAIVCGVTGDKNWTHITLASVRDFECEGDWHEDRGD